MRGSLTHLAFFTGYTDPALATPEEPSQTDAMGEPSSRPIQTDPAVADTETEGTRGPSIQTVAIFHPRRPTASTQLWIQGNMVPTVQLDIAMFIAQRAGIIGFFMTQPHTISRPLQIPGIRTVLAIEMPSPPAAIQQDMGAQGTPMAQPAQQELDIDQQTVIPESSPMQVGQVDIGHSTSRTTKKYPQTQDLVLRAQGHPRVQMLYMDTKAPEGPAIMKLNDHPRQYYMLKPEVEQMACPNAAFGEPPRRSGSGCLPCYVAHLESIHNPDDSRLEVEKSWPSGRPFLLHTEQPHTTRRTLSTRTASIWRILRGYPRGLYAPFYPGWSTYYSRRARRTETSWRAMEA